jgi:hypothetical protein
MSVLKTALSIGALLFAVQGANGQTLGPDFADDYSITDLGSIDGLPADYGGMVFRAGDPDVLLIGGAANTADGLIYQVPVIRDDDDNIVGFGPIAPLGSVGEYNDGGVAYGPTGVLFTSQWNENMLGQTLPGSLDEDKIIDLEPLGITTDTSISGLNFVPTGFAGAGKFKVVSWSGGSWYDVVLAPDGGGTFDIVGSALQAVLGGGPEGFVFIDDEGNEGFDVDSLLIAEYSDGAIAVYDLNENGDPIVTTRRDFVTGLTGAEGAAIDPLTGDFLFSTFGGGDRIIRVDGFTRPPLFAGSVTGMFSGQTRCVNRSLAERIATSLRNGLTEASWDCIAIGLNASAGDSVRVHINGVSTGESVAGVASEFEEGAFVRCENRTAGIRIGFPLGSDGTWVCPQADLALQPDDRVRVHIRGVLR